MSKRFTDSTKWERPWFRKLDPTRKLTFLYLLDKCDRAGFWEIDIERMEFELRISDHGVNCLEDWFDGLKDVVVRHGVLFIEDFVSFQYPGGLNESNKAHKGIVECLKKRLGAFPEAQKHLSWLSPCQGATEGALDGDKETEEEKEKETDKEEETEAEVKKPKYPEDFERFWKAYPKKKKKDDGLKAWKKRKRDLPPIDELVNIVAAHAKTSDWTKDGGQFIPYPASWLNSGSWEDEIEGVFISTATPPEAWKSDYIEKYRTDPPETWEEVDDDYKQSILKRAARRGA